MNKKVINLIHVHFATTELNPSNNIPGRVRERMSFKQLAIIFPNLAHFPHIRQNPEPFLKISLKKVILRVI